MTWDSIRKGGNTSHPQSQLRLRPKSQKGPRHRPEEQHHHQHCQQTGRSEHSERRVAVTLAQAVDDPICLKSITIETITCGISGCRLFLTSGKRGGTTEGFGRVLTMWFKSKFGFGFGFGKNEPIKLKILRSSLELWVILVHNYSTYIPLINPHLGSKGHKMGFTSSLCFSIWVNKNKPQGGRRVIKSLVWGGRVRG